MEQSNAQTDRECLIRMAAGDEQAFRQIYNRYYRTMVMGLMRMLNDVDTCREIAQEVFVEIWNKRATFEVHTSLPGYLRRASINKALNYIKKNKRYVFETLENQVDVADDHEVQVEKQGEAEDVNQALYKAIETLPERCRIVFTLSRFEDMSHREIAEQLNISTKTIENQITKAMKILREALIQYKNLSAIVIMALNQLL